MRHAKDAVAWGQAHGGVPRQLQLCLLGCCCGVWCVEAGVLIDTTAVVCGVCLDMVWCVSCFCCWLAAQHACSSLCMGACRATVHAV